MPTPDRQSIRHRQQQRVWRYLLNTNGRGATDDEMAEAFGAFHNSVAPARRALVRRGLVHASEWRQLTRSRAWATVWRCGAGPEQLAEELTTSQRRLLWAVNNGAYLESIDDVPTLTTAGGARIGLKTGSIKEIERAIDHRRKRA